MNRFIIKYFTNPLWEFAAGRKTLSYLKELEKSQHWPLEKLEELQNQRLRALLKHAYENVPYYRRVFRERKLKPEDVKDIHDLKKLPVLTKELIAKNFDDMKVRNMDLFKPTLYRTGGSTGRPLVFYNAKKTFEYHLAAMYRAWKWIGFDFGSKYADLWGATFDLKDEHKLKKRIHMWLTHNRLLVPSFRFTPEGLEKYSEQIVRFKPEYIHGYASSIEVMADYMKKRGMSLEGVKGVITSGEKLFPHQRK
ncbi:phenylacetate--CoA ligase family protein, partial [Candidatus Woesearchaeota archaeon]